MPGLWREFDAPTGQITWSTVDEQGDEFSMTLGPDETTDGGLYLALELPDGSFYEGTIDLSGLSL